jgi:hypothetical protein
MLLPPIVKIYRDGRIVFLDDRGVWEGKLPARRLDRLTTRLAANPLLKGTRLIPIRKGRSAGLHGGMAYIRYLEAENEVVIGALLLPSGGPWDRLVREIRGHIPSSYASFHPEAVSVRVFRGSSRAEPVPWPFSSTVPLSPHADQFGDLLTVSDPSLISFLLQHVSGG